MTEFYNDLKDLSDPHKYNAAITLDNLSTTILLDFHRSICTIRRCEEVLGDLSRSREVKTPVHLGIGQEAIAVGVASNLNSNDRVFSNHRSHCHYLSMGASIDKLFAEVLGKASGASQGMGGSMHLVAEDSGFWGSVPIVGGTIPIAVGAALASKHDGKGSIAIAYFGDGACEEGILHESLNLAQVMNLPIVFICENNLYSSHMEMFQRQPSNSVKRFADAHKMKGYLIDGNDVVAVQAHSKEAIERARGGGGPAFIEAVTFRWRGHVGPEVDLDVGVSRSIEELHAWMKRDPLRRLELSLIQDRGLSEEAFLKVKREIGTMIDECVDRARSNKQPDIKNILEFVYAKN